MPDNQQPRGGQRAARSESAAEREAAARSETAATEREAAARDEAARTDRPARAGLGASFPAQLPDFRVLHDGVGVFLKGDLIPTGTYDEEQLARLVGLGAIEPVDPPMLPRGAESPAAAVAASAEEFKAEQEALALEAAGGDLLSAVDLSDEQRAELRRAGYADRAAIRAASDEQLAEVPGVRSADVRRLREAAG